MTTTATEAQTAWRAEQIGAAWRPMLRTPDRSWPLDAQFGSEEECNQFIRMLPAGDVEGPLKQRLIAAREMFEKARSYLRHAYDAGDLGYGQYERFTEEVTGMQPTAPDGQLNEEYVSLMEAAVKELRVRAVQKFRDNAICSGGCDKFLAAMGFDTLTDQELTRY